MTLFEAIRALKEGQAIEERIPGGPYRKVIVWEHEKDFRIVDLPKPKMSLEEGLRSALARRIVYQLDARAMADHLRSLPIDWLAEAGRKDNLK